MAKWRRVGPARLWTPPGHELNGHERRRLGKNALSDLRPARTQGRYSIRSAPFTRLTIRYIAPTARGMVDATNSLCSWKADRRSAIVSPRMDWVNCSNKWSTFTKNG